MSESDAWARLHDGQSYKIYDKPEGWLDHTPFGGRYTVTAPSGRIRAVRGTLRGARSVIREHQQRRGPERKWWEYPIAEEVPGQDQRSVANGDQTTGIRRADTWQAQR